MLVRLILNDGTMTGRRDGQWKNNPPRTSASEIARINERGVMAYGAARELRCIGGRQPDIQTGRDRVLSVAPLTKTRLSRRMEFFMWTFLLAIFGAIFFVPGLLSTVTGLFGIGTVA